MKLEVAVLLELGFSFQTKIRELFTPNYSLLKLPGIISPTLKSYQFVTFSIKFYNHSTDSDLERSMYC